MCKNKKMPSRQTTAAAAHGSDQVLAEQQRYWSSLPDDLLGEIYLRLAAPLPRARFAATCPSWRAAASKHPPPPALPWLMLDPLAAGDKQKRSVYSPQDRAVLPLPSEGAGAGAGGCFVGCHDGGWVACSSELNKFRIVNLFSGAEIPPASPEQKRVVTHDQNGNPLAFQKIIFSEAPTSSHGCILAAITETNGVAICTVGSLEDGHGWIFRRGLHRASVMDIAFCNGELYGLTRYSKELNKFEIGLHKDGRPFFKAVSRLAMQNPCSEIFPEMHGVYIVELCGRIVMAVRRTKGRRPFSGNIRGPFFAVFELVDAAGSEEEASYKWAEVTSLGDHALFLGPICSKVVHVPDHGHGYARRNHVYYSHHRCFTDKDVMPRAAKEFSRTSGINGCHQVYYTEDDESIYDGIIEGIMSVGYYVRGGLHPPMWIFPPDL